MRPFILVLALFAAVLVASSAEAHGNSRFQGRNHRHLSDFERGVIAGQQSRGHYNPQPFRGSQQFNGYGRPAILFPRLRIIF